MPVYEYKCARCGRVTEVFAQLAENALPPSRCGCGSDAEFTRQFSAFATTSAGHAVPDTGCCSGEGANHPCGGACQCGHAH